MEGSRATTRRAGTRAVGLAQAARGRAVRAMSGSAKLYDIPVSNNGARCRIAIYAKGLEDKIDIVPPSDLGGIKSEEYMALNPKGKMPLLITEGGIALWESEVILQYILDKYDGPSFTLETPEERALCALSTKIFDTYMQPIQGCLYRVSESAEQRASELKVMDENLHTLEDYCSGGEYFCGPSPSSADMSLFPSFVFFEVMLERHFGWKDWGYEKPKLKSWYDNLKSGGDGSEFTKHTRRVYDEIYQALVAWEEGGRWETTGVNAHKKEEEYKWVYP
ncbi:glutathione S-transferase [Chloropicon primus]|nr:glutathione S-transferase [Chloropicon primus]